MNNTTENRGVFTQIYQSNANQDESSKVNAELLVLKKDSDANLEIDPDSIIPDWLTIGSDVLFNIVWPSKGVVIFSGKITYIIGQRVHIGNLQYRETIQRRKDVKVRYDEEGLLYSGDKLSKFSIRFKDISAGGAGFTAEANERTRLTLERGKTCILSFIPFDEKRIELTSTIVRASESNGIIHCGIAFKNVRPGVEMNLRQLVFQLQKRETLKDKSSNKFESIEIDVFMQD